MTNEERQLFRQAMEVQFRHRMSKDINFPFLQSLGIKDVLQGFGNEEVGFIGVLHLKWSSGEWVSTWYDSPEDGHRIAEEIESQNIIDTEKVMIMIHEKQMKYERMKLRSLEVGPLLN